VQPADYPHNVEMTVDSHGQREQTLADYLAVVRRYVWLIVIVALVVPIAAYTMSARQPNVYRATADVLVNRSDLGSTVTGLSPQGWVDPDRFMRNQAALARIPAVTDLAVEKAGVRLEGWELAGMSNASPQGSTDILQFGVNTGDPELAVTLANAYAAAFVDYKLELETTTLARARQEIQGRLAELRTAGAADTDAYRELQRKALDLRTLEVLQTPASVVRPAGGGWQIAPAPRRNATLGVLLGLMLGLGGAFLLNALDRRVRHADEVERQLQIPLLAKLPTPKRNDPLTILERPADEVTEAVARLRTSFDFANADAQTKLVMATSAGAREGKSTTVTNLAIALARAGRRVVLVDLDLRRPSIARLLHLPDRAGITDVVAGTADLADALQPIVVTPLRARLTGTASGDGGSGALEVITAGRARVDPGEFVESAGLAQALHTLRGRAEIVLLDTPPVLATGDAMALSAKVDAVLLVSRLGTLTRPALRELVRMLSRSPAPVLGWVATGAEIDEGYSTYKAHDSYLAPPRPRSANEAPPPARLEVPEPRSASAGSGRWAPRRSGG
jgi:polysaccharide biosynthesis transport protein